MEDLADVDLPVIFTEGEFKCIALSCLAHHLTKHARFVPVGLNGIYGWRGTVGKDHDHNGVRRPIKGVISDIDLIAMRGRLAYIAFDTDAKATTLADVRRARTRFAQELLERGAVDVRLIEIPAEANAKGIDDVLAAWGPERVLDELIARAQSFISQKKSTEYFARDGRLWRKTYDRHGVEIELLLANFIVQVAENRMIDNGVEEEAQLVYRLCAVRSTGLHHGNSICPTRGSKSPIGRNMCSAQKTLTPKLKPPNMCAAPSRKSLWARPGASLTVTWVIARSRESDVSCTGQGQLESMAS